ncbi:MAG: methyl-accepting chemotaxis protein [Spirochaetales bacterium]|jgi:methyl-accepting chemotaxis protein|nr:methyl-accepting chemotaxis protein [Spirochaetales bacterium]
MLRNISIGIRIIIIITILLLSLLGLIAMVFFTAESVKDRGIADAEQVMLEGEQEKLRLGTQTMAAALSKALEGVTDGGEQHDIISAYIKDYRFEEDKSGYYYTYKGTVIFMHPTLPKREGEDLGNTADVNGVYYVRELYENARKGGGFVSFVFPKPPSMEQAPKLAYVEYIPGTDIWISTGIYIDNIDAYKANMEKRINDDLKERMIFLIGAFAVFLLFILGPLCVFTLKSIIGPLKATVKAAELFASGNLEATLRVSGHDEITVLQDAFLRMAQNINAGFVAVRAKEAEALAQAGESRKVADKIRQIAVHVEKAAHDMEAAVSSISRISNGVKSGGEAQNGKIAEIVSSMKQLSSGVGKITESAAVAANRSEESDKRVESGVSMAQAAGRAMQSLHSLTGSLTENVNKLGEQSGNIGSIMAVITDIADQINLLAMNASIEAAHAGEAGRGFAVVGGEVRKLAEKTMTAAREVGASIAEMQKLAEVNISGMDKAVASISEVTNLSEKTENSLSEAQTIVRDSMLQVRSIASAVEEQSASSTEVMSLVNDVSGIAQENVSLIAQVDEELQALLKKGTDLLGVVSELRK